MRTQNINIMQRVELEREVDEQRIESLRNML